MYLQSSQQPIRIDVERIGEVSDPVAVGLALFDRRIADARNCSAGRKPHRFSDRHRIDLGGAVAGSGWHAPEFNAANGQGFRWTGPAPDAQLQLALADDKDLTIKVSVCRAACRANLRDINLLLNGKPLLFTRQRTERGTDLEATIPKDIIHYAPVRSVLTIQVPETTTLRRLLRTVDGRFLGVAVSRIEITPASAIQSPAA